MKSAWYKLPLPLPLSPLELTTLAHVSCPCSELKDINGDEQKSTFKIKHGGRRHTIIVQGNDFEESSGTVDFRDEDHIIEYFLQEADSSDNKEQRLSLHPINGVIIPYQHINLKGVCCRPCRNAWSSLYSSLLLHLCLPPQCVIALFQLPLAAYTKDSHWPLGSTFSFFQRAVDMVPEVKERIEAAWFRGLIIAPSGMSQTTCKPTKMATWSVKVHNCRRIIPPCLPSPTLCR